MIDGRTKLKNACAAFACVVGLHAGAAQADSCARSLHYILSTASDDVRKPQLYQRLYKSCLQTMQLSNVKDAFILKSGAIAVLPRNDSVPATAGTLAQFCTRFPDLTLRFITRKEERRVKSVARVVRMSTSQSTPCQKITGGG